jgi:hypothetical protein
MPVIATRTGSPIGAGSASFAVAGGIASRPPPAGSSSPRWGRGR